MNEQELELFSLIEDDNLLLTTIDNPFNPHDEYDAWKIWDEDNEYNTESLIAHLANIDLDDTDDVVRVKIDLAVHEILTNDRLEVYKLV